MATAAAAPATDDIEERARQVETTIRFVDPGDFVTRRYVRAGAEINTGTYSDHRVIVRDGMPIRDHFEFDVHGFRIAEQPSAVRDFHDKEEVDRIYEAEVERHVRALTGADKVVARGWMIRSSADLSEIAQEGDPRVIEIDTRDVTNTETNECRHDPSDRQPLRGWAAPHQAPIQGDEPVDKGLDRPRGPGRNPPIWVVGQSVPRAVGWPGSSGSDRPVPGRDRCLRRFRPRPGI